MKSNTPCLPTPRRLPALLFAAGLAAGVTQGIVLDTRSNLAVSEAEVRLQDLVVNPAVLPTNWGARVVVPAPAPGSPRQFSLMTLARGLQPYADMADVQLRGPSRVMIERTGVPLGIDRIAAVLEAYVRTHEEWKMPDPVVRCEPPDLAIMVPTNAPPPSVTAVTPTEQPNRYRFDLTIDDGSRDFRNLTVFAEVQSAARVWVAARDLARGHVLAAGDLAESRMASSGAARFMNAGTSAIGLELIRPVRAGQRLEPHCVGPPLCARQGDMLEVALQRGPLRVFMQAKALATGHKDERIFCLNETSGQRLAVRLTDTRQATVDY